MGVSNETRGVFLGSIDAKEITGAALNVGGGVVMD